MSQLDIDSIAEAARAQVIEHGVEGFSMRAVAKSLNVTPMALYYHVKNKADLARLVIDRANAAQSLTPISGDWKEDMWQVARSTRQTMTAHPQITELLRVYRAWSSDMLEKTEYWMNLWKLSGLQEEEITLAAAASSAGIIGLIEYEVTRQNAQPLDDELFKSKPKAEKLFKLNADPEQLFELAVRSLIDGIYARLNNTANSQ